MWWSFIEKCLDYFLFSWWFVALPSVILSRRHHRAQTWKLRPSATRPRPPRCPPIPLNTTMLEITGAKSVTRLLVPCLIFSLTVTAKHIERFVLVKAISVGFSHSSLKQLPPSHLYTPLCVPCLHVEFSGSSHSLLTLTTDPGLPLPPKLSIPPVQKRGCPSPLKVNVLYCDAMLFTDNPGVWGPERSQPSSASRWTSVWISAALCLFLNENDAMEWPLEQRGDSCLFFLLTNLNGFVSQYFPTMLCF